MPISNRLIRFTSLATTTVLAVSLVACGEDSDDQESPSPTPSVSVEESPSPAPTVEPSALTSIDEISVTEDLAVEPAVDGPWPFYVDQTESKVIVAGEGDVVPHDKAAVQLHYSGINATTGAPFDSSWMRGKPTTFLLNQVVPGFSKGLVGKRVGDRVLIVITSDDGYGDQGNPQAGINGGDTLIFVVDILVSQLSGPSGEEVEAVPGLPIVTDEAGVPSISMDGTEVPTEARTQAIIQGGGRTLEATDILVSHSRCVRWDGSEYYSDYGAEPSTDAPTGRVHKNLWAALVGSQVGSRVLVVLPGELAYPDGSSEPSIDPNTPVACVVDLLYAEAS